MNQQKPRSKCRKCGATMKKFVRYNHISTYPHNEPQFAFPTMGDECKDCGFIERDEMASMHLKYMRNLLVQYRSKFDGTEKVSWDF